MIVETKVGPQIASDSSIILQRASRSGATVSTDAHARFYEAVARGNVYYLAGGALPPAAFTGGAGGQPLISIYNPTGSGKLLTVLAASIGVTAVPTAAGVVNPELYAGVSAIPTGTATAPVNALTQVATGSVARGSLNVATTSSSAITIALALSSFWWATAAAGAVTSNGLQPVEGLVTASPGVLVALGVRTVPTSLTVTCSLFWEEVPI